MSLTTSTIWSANTCVWKQSLSMDNYGNVTLRRRYHNSSAVKHGRVGAVPSAFLPPDVTSEDGAHNFELGPIRRAIDVLVNPDLPWTDFLPIAQHCAQLLATYHDKAALKAVEGTGGDQRYTNVHLKRIRDYASVDPVNLPVNAQEQTEMLSTLEALTAKDRLLPCHGNASVGTVYLQAKSDKSASTGRALLGPPLIPTGPEALWAAPELDLGWFLGDVIEIIVTTPSKFSKMQRDSPWSHPLVEAIIQSYIQSDPPLSLSTSLLVDAAWLRVCLHMCDFATTTGDIEGPRKVLDLLLRIDWKEKNASHPITPFATATAVNSTTMLKGSEENAH